MYTQLTMLKKEAFFTGILFLMIMSFGLASAELSLPGMLESTGTYFEIEGSEYINVSISSTEEINVYLESSPKIVILSIESSGLSNNTSTELILGGFEPNKTYYMYENTHTDGTNFTTDSLGSYTYTQDISQRNQVWIQERKSTTFIDENTTLTSDISGTVEINTSGITLDCDGHSIIGPSSAGFGVYIPNGIDRITIKNCKISTFSRGIYLVNSNNNFLENNTVENTTLGIDLKTSKENLIINNIVSENGRGIRIFSGTEEEGNNIVVGNTVFGNGDGVDLLRAINNTIKENNIYTNTEGGFRIIVSSSNKIYNNLLNNSINTYNFGPNQTTNINAWNIAKTLQQNIVSGAYLGGNFWANPSGTGFSQTCTDSNSDGICDSTYAVDDNNTDDFPLTFQFSNSAPTLEEIHVSLDPFEVNTSVSANATFEDENILDTHTAIWTWGDNTNSSGTISESNGSGTITGSHSYTTAGVYTVTLVVSDGTEDSNQSVFKYVVVYDPTAGFVTGGGWIDSPLGAYTPNSNITGKANFGFVSKYIKNQPLPIGQAKFVLSIADFSFKSTEYDWLVVAGEKAKFKGEGKINNQEGYSFMVSAVDGESKNNDDTFRIKIWNTTTEIVIYDNQLGDDDDADANQSIGGGNIVVHTD